MCGTLAAELRSVNTACLTFEVRRGRRKSAGPAGRMINRTWKRARWFAVGPRLDRGVRAHSVRTVRGQCLAGPVLRLETGRAAHRGESWMVRHRRAECRIAEKIEAALASWCTRRCLRRAALVPRARRTILALHDRTRHLPPPRLQPSPVPIRGQGR